MKIIKLTALSNFKNKLCALKNQFIAQDASLSFSERRDLMISIKETYFSNKKNILSSSQNPDLLSQCLDLLNINEDLSSLLLMLSGKTLTDTEATPDILKQIDNILYKIAFIEKIKEFESFSSASVFFKHLTNVIQTTNKDSFNHFIEYLFSNIFPKKLNVEEFPCLQNTACMRLSFMITQSSDDPLYSLFHIPASKLDNADQAKDLNIDPELMKLKNNAGAFLPELINSEELVDSLNTYDEKTNISAMELKDKEKLPEIRNTESYITTDSFFKKSTYKEKLRKNPLTCREEAEAGFALR